MTRLPPLMLPFYFPNSLHEAASQKYSRKLPEETPKISYQNDVSTFKQNEKELKSSALNSLIWALLIAVLVFFAGSTALLLSYDSMTLTKAYLSADIAAPSSKPAIKQINSSASTSFLGAAVKVKEEKGLKV